jgi:type IV secretion system protein VirB9
VKALLLGTVAAMLAAMAAPAWAEQIPTSGPRDPRVRTVVYDPMNVVDITGVIRAATEIEFAPTETIEKVAGGDATSWLVAPAGNLMFLKPTQALPPSNLVVVTRRPDGSQRSYVFELTVRDGDMTRNTPQTYFKVVFRYPADEAAAKQAELARTAQAAAKRDADSRLDVDFFYGVRNWAYTAQGDAALQPTEVSDNGRVTVFRFPGNMEVPVIYEIKADGTESIVPRTVRGDQVIVDAIARQFRIRAGSQVLCIFNRRFDPIGQHQGTGTVSPDVSRQVKEPVP